MRTRHRLQIAALVCAGVALVAGVVAYNKMPAVTGPITDASAGVLVSYGYAVLAGVSLVAAAVLAGLAVRWDPAGAQGRCTRCRTPVPTTITFCPACGTRAPGRSP